MFKQNKKQPPVLDPQKVQWDPGLNLATPATRQPGCRQTRSKAATLADIRKVTKRPFYTPPSWQAGVDAAETWTVLRVGKNVFALSQYWQKY
jgi:hypothetical protein